MRSGIQSTDDLRLAAFVVTIISVTARRRGPLRQAETKSSPSITAMF